MKLMPSIKTLKILIMLLSIVSSSVAWSASNSDKPKTRKAAAMSQKVYKKLNVIQQLIEKKDYISANSKLKVMRSSARKLSPYEKAQSWNLSAYILYLQENYPSAISTYQKVLDQGELPDALVQSTIKTMAQLYFATEQYGLALSSVQLLLTKVKVPTANMYMLLGQANFQLKKYKDALIPIKKAIALFRKQNRKPKESWLQLLRVIYHYENDYKNMLIVLEEMVDLYPKDAHLRALAGVYSELGDTDKQLTMMEALYERDYKQSSSQILNLANLYLVQGMPYKAAKVLDQELNVSKRVKVTEQSYRLLSQSWYQAREDLKSIAPLYKAAELSESGELYIRIAQAYQNLDQWDKAAKAIQIGLKKGELKRPDTAQLMLGMVLFNQQKLELSQQHFELALKDKRSEKVAGQWLAYVQNELHRKTVLESATTK